MTTDEKIKALIPLTGRLHALLQAPEPGLSMWMNEVGRLLSAIASFAPPSPSGGNDGDR